MQSTRLTFHNQSCTYSVRIHAHINQCTVVHAYTIQHNILRARININKSTVFSNLYNE